MPWRWPSAVFRPGRHRLPLAAEAQGRHRQRDHRAASSTAARVPPRVAARRSIAAYAAGSARAQGRGQRAGEVEPAAGLPGRIPGRQGASERGGGHGRRDASPGRAARRPGPGRRGPRRASLGPRPATNSRRARTPVRRPGAGRTGRTPARQERPAEGHGVGAHRPLQALGADPRSRPREHRQGRRRARAAGHRAARSSVPGTFAVVMAMRFHVLIVKISASSWASSSSPNCSSAPA